MSLHLEQELSKHRVATLAPSAQSHILLIPVYSVVCLACGITTYLLTHSIVYVLSCLLIYVLCTYLLDYLLSYSLSYFIKHVLLCWSVFTLWSNRRRKQILALKWRVKVIEGQAFWRHCKALGLLHVLSRWKLCQNAPKHTSFTKNTEQFPGRGLGTPFPTLPSVPPTVDPGLAITCCQQVRKRNRSIGVSEVRLLYTDYRHVQVS